MAVEIRQLSVTTPHGVAIATPMTTRFTMPARVIDRIEVIVPPGPNGNMGFAIAVASQVVIPYNPNQYIVADDLETGWDLSDYPDSGDWSIVTYNTGSFNHTVQFKFLCSLVGSQQVTGNPIAVPATSVSDLSVSFA